MLWVEGVEGLWLLPIFSSRQGAVCLVLCSTGIPIYMLNAAFLICETCTLDCPLVSCQKAVRASHVPPLQASSSASPSSWTAEGTSAGLRRLIGGSRCLPFGCCFCKSHPKFANSPRQKPKSGVRQAPASSCRAKPLPPLTEMAPDASCCSLCLRSGSAGRSHDGACGVASLRLPEDSSCASACVGWTHAVVERLYQGCWGLRRRGSSWLWSPRSGYLSCCSGSFGWLK